MAAPHVGRLAGWVTGCALSSAMLGATFGPAWILVGVGCSVVATLWVVLWLPRSAHAAFEAAKFARAGRRYRVIAALAFSAARERAALLSRAGCDLAAGKREAADAALAELQPADTMERVVWLNNRAWSALEAGPHAAIDPHAALALVDEAIALRPDVPAIQHTRARALLAVGRTDDAIAVLDAMRAGGELSTRLEADRCRDLATAWAHKGQAAYADDYRERARLVATR